LSLESRFTYTLKVVTPVQDLANNKSEKDEEYDFPGTDLVAPDNYIIGVEIINAKNIKVKAYSDISQYSVSLYYDETDEQIDIIAKKDPTAKKEVTITLLNTALRSGVDYRVTVGSMKYVFEGTAEDTVTFYDDGEYTVVTYNDMKSSDKVLVNNERATAVLDKDNEVECFRVKLGIDADGKNLPVETILVERDGVTLYFYVEEGKDATIDAPDAVNDYNSLVTILKDVNVKDIKLTGSVTVPAGVSELVIDRLVNIDLNGKNIIGNVKVNTSEIGKMTIKNTNTTVAEINGNLTVNVPNADFVVGNKVKVSETTTIKDVKSNTFYNYGTINKVVVNVTKTITLVNTGTINGVEIQSTNPVTIESNTDLVITISNEKGEKVKVVLNGETYEVDDKLELTDNKDVEAVYEEVYEAVYEGEDLEVSVAEMVKTGLEVAKAKGATISWESDNEDVLSIKINDDKVEVKVNAPEEEVEVTLTATIKKGVAKLVGEFKFTVAPAQKTEEE